MKVNLFKAREYDFVFPQRDPEADSGFEAITIADKITIKCKRIDLAAKREIEDSMISVTGDKFQRAKGIDDVAMSYAIGTVKDLRIRQSVTGWGGVEDEEGNPVKFRWDCFEQLLLCNAGLDPDAYGLLETELLEVIDKENSFADSTQVTGKNSQKSS